jgi:hypothetical protein
LTIRPRLQADAPDDFESREDVSSSAAVLKPATNPAAKIGSNENNPPVPAWLSSRNRSVQPGRPANGNGHEGASASGRSTGKRAERDWQYDWDAATPAAAKSQGKQRGRLFLPRKSAVQARQGRPIVRRLILSAACLAIVAAMGGGFLLLSGHGFKQTVPVAAQIKQKKAPVVAENATAKPVETKQASVKAAEAVSPKAAAASASTSVNEAQKAAALPARTKAATVAKLPAPDSARWASNVVPPDRALSNAHGGKPAPQSMTAFASASGAVTPAPAGRPAGDAKSAPEMKSASLTPSSNADDAATSSIPDDQAPAEKTNPATKDAAPEAASKPVESGGRHAVVTTATNMRAGPENRSHVLLVVPAKASVELFGCDQWCKVAYNGHEGYIYKSFVSRSGRVHVPAAAHRATTEKSRVASTDSGKLIGGAVVDSGASTAAAQPAAPAAAPAQPAQPAASGPAALPATMGHDRH